MTSRIPVRIRLVIAFAAVMAVVLTATGMFVYLRVADELGDTVDRELGARLASVVTIVRDDGDDLGDPDDDPLQAVDQGGPVQVLDSAGKVAGTTEPALGSNPVLPPAQVRALRAGKTVDVSVVALDEDLRLAGAPAEDDGEDYTVIVGAVARAAPGGARRPQPRAAARRPDRAPARVARGLRRGRRARCGRSSTCGAGRRSCSRPARRAGGCRCRPRATRSPTSARP